MQNLRVTLIQSQLHWEDIDQNLEMFGQKIAGIESENDLILLPETFSTGFSMNPEKLAEDSNGKAINFLKDQTSAKSCAVAGSILYSENGKYFNRFVVALPNGSVAHYDKRHLFSLGKEDRQFSAGKDKLILEIANWKINFQVCYDLRFPVFSRNIIDPETNQPEYDCLVYVANWPKIRNEAWKKLLIARAIENQCYVVGVNRVGDDGRGVAHSGDSCVIDPYGEIEFTKADEPVTHSAALSASTLQKCRESLPFLNDADRFTIHN